MGTRAGSIRLVAASGAVAVVVFLVVLADPARADQVVMRDGKVVAGVVQLDRKDRSVQIDEVSIPFDRLYLVEADDGALLWAAGFLERLRGYEILAHRHLAKQYLDLARKARAASDWELGWKAINLAENVGLASRDAARIKLKLTKITGTGSAGRRNKPLAKAVAALDTYHGELLARRAERALANPKDRDGLRLLQRALKRVPGSARAQKLLTAAAPDDFPIKGGPRVWLRWHLELERNGARLLRKPPVPLRRARKKWRPDLHAVLGSPILIVTPVKNSRIVGRCMNTGRLACRVLGQLFQTDRPVRKPTKPLTVFLYESRAEYRSVSGTGRQILDPVFLEQTAGHYSPRDGISRFFWFSDPAAERRIVGTCVHELTHHWLSEHNPRTGRRRPGAFPGYWIVEGFATFMEEGVYDIDSGKWDLFNPRARSLDVLQSADPRMLIDWERFFLLPQALFRVLPADNRLTVQLRWSLRPTIVSTRRMFYEQAAAVCQFLYHGDGGKHRGRLIDFVCSHYNGRTKRLNPQKAFRMTSAELGKRTVEFAKAVAAGWTPKPRRDK